MAVDETSVLLSESSSSQRQASAAKRSAYILGSGFFGVFVAFNVAQSLATSISGPPGLGNLVFAAIYATYTILCIPAPKVVSLIGAKASIIFGALPYAGVLLAHLAPPRCATAKEGTLCWDDATISALQISMGILVGVGAPLLWTGQGIYLAKCAASFSSMTGSDVSDANKSFNGIFFSFFQYAGFAGTCSGSLILLLVKGGGAVYILFLIMGIVCGLGVLLFLLFLPGMETLRMDVNSAPVEEASASSEAERVTVLQTLKLFFSDAKMYLFCSDHTLQRHDTGIHLWQLYTARVDVWPRHLLCRFWYSNLLFSSMVWRPRSWEGSRRARWACRECFLPPLSSMCCSLRFCASGLSSSLLRQFLRFGLPVLEGRCWEHECILCILRRKGKFVPCWL